MSIHNNCDISTLLSYSSLAYAVTYVANDWDRKFNKLKQAFTCVDACLYSYVSYIHFSEMCSKTFDRLLRALMGFDKKQ